MDVLVAGVAGVAGMVAGATAGSRQHLLYRDAEMRKNPAAGRRALAIRLGLAGVCALIVALAFRPDHYELFPAALTAVFCIVLAVAASTDFERRRIPNRLTYPAFIAALAVSWAWPDRGVTDILIGLAFGTGLGVVFFAFGLLAKGGIGFGLGDVKLMMLIGALVGWPAAMPGLFLGVMLAGLPAVVLLAMGRRKAHFAYGPYLAAAGVVVLLFPANFG